jgi:hypothetical protein
MVNLPRLTTFSEGDHEHWQDAVCASHGVHPLVEFLQNCNPVLPADLCHRQPRIAFGQHPNNLTLRELRLPHPYLLKGRKPQFSSCCQRREVYGWALFISTKSAVKINRQVCFNFLPGHMGGKNCNRVVEQIDHLNQLAAEKSSVWLAGDLRPPEKEKATRKQHQ